MIMSKNKVEMMDKWQMNTAFNCLLKSHADYETYL